MKLTPDDLTTTLPSHPDSSDHECCQCESDEPLRQGDIFLWRDHVPSDPWKQIGLILTATCDLVHQKTFGFINYLPILSLDDYLSLFWTPAQLESVTASIANDLCSWLRKMQKKYAPETGHIDDDFLCHELLVRYTAVQLTSSFGPDCSAAQMSKLAGISERLAFYAAAKKWLSTRSQTSERIGLELLLRGVGLHHKNPPQGPLKHIQGALRNHLSNLPGDLLYIDQLPLNDVRGFLVMLRFIGQIGINAIQPNWGLATRHNAICFRIARLQAPFLYHMTQKFARVFTDIGLPSTYDHRRRGVADMLPIVLQGED